MNILIVLAAFVAGAVVDRIYGNRLIAEATSIAASAKAEELKAKDRLDSLLGRVSAAKDTAQAVVKAAETELK
jgi:hypothetical protein